MTDRYVRARFSLAEVATLEEICVQVCLFFGCLGRAEKQNGWATTHVTLDDLATFQAVLVSLTSLLVLQLAVTSLFDMI